MSKICQKKKTNILPSALLVKVNLKKNIFKYALRRFWSFLRYTRWVFSFVGYPGWESNLGCQDGNLASNQLDYPDFLNIKLKPSLI